ncbi:MAG: hypothetical protein ACLGHZ_11400 [Actinomycetes bacterium]
MRNPTALDATVRWLVLTGAAVVVIVMVPPSALGDKAVLSLGGLGRLNAVHVVAVGVIVVAWAQCMVHMLRLKPRMHGDGWAIGLGVATGAGLVATVIAAFVGTPVSVVSSMATAGVLTLLFALRIDHRAALKRACPA